MPYKLKIPGGLAGWKIQIYDKERLDEPPHVTVTNGKGCTWRFSLSTREPLDPSKPGCTIHKQILKLLDDNWEKLTKEWNKMFEKNQVVEQQGEGNEH